MSKAKKLSLYYGISTADAETLIAAGITTPRIVKADKDAVDQVDIEESERVKVKAR